MKILAVDYGDARTGLAICDAGEMLASPVGVIHSHRMDEVVQKAAEAAREQRAERIVVGNPINMNGTRGPRSELCQEFAAKLGEASPFQRRTYQKYCSPTADPVQSGTAQTGCSPGPGTVSHPLPWG